MLSLFLRVRDRNRMAETPCRGEAAGAAGQTRGAKRLEPDRQPAAPALARREPGTPINKGPAVPSQSLIGKRRSAVLHGFYLSNEQFLLYGIKRLKTSQKIKLLQEILAVTGQGNGRGYEVFDLFYSCLYDTGQFLPVFLQGLMVQIAQGLDYPVFKDFPSLSEQCRLHAACLISSLVCE